MIYAILIILIFSLWMAVKKIKNMEKTNQNLTHEKAKMSDALRLKGIEVDRLTGKIKRLEKEA